MKRILRSRTGWRVRRVWCLVGAMVCVAAWATEGSAVPTLRCGDPTKVNGFVTVSIILKRGTERHYIDIRDMRFGAGETDTSKAEFIVQHIRQIDDPNGEYLVATRPPGSADVQMQGRNGWIVETAAVIGDSTAEPDYIAFDGPASTGQALCSITGTATGTSPTGGAGVVAVRAFGATAQVPTPQGMPAQAVEVALMQQLQAQGANVRWAQPGDLQQGHFQGLLNDGVVLLIEPPTPSAPGSIFESVMDNGLELDIVALSVPASAPASAAFPMEAPRLQLDASPNPFAEGIVVRYGSLAGGGAGVITVHDASGRLLRSLFHGHCDATGAVRWDGRDARGRMLPGGTYFLMFETPAGRRVERVTRIR